MKLNYLSPKLLNEKNIFFPDADTIDVCIFPINNFSCLADGATLLSEQEQKRAAAFRLEKDRLRFLTGHILLRKILSLYLHYPAEKLTFHTGTHGKLCLCFEEAALPQIHFNLSHSEDFAALAFSCSSPVGIDIEKVRANIRAETLVRRFFHPDEYAEFLTLDETERQTFLFRRWTVREAFLKGLGDGFTTPPDAFCVQELSSVFRIKKSQKDYSFWRIEPVLAPDGYYCSIAYQTS